MAEKEIFKKMIDSKKPVSTAEYPDRPGLYAIFLVAGGVLGEFAIGGKIIYFGKAEDSLSQRDFKTHFSSGGTGRSTLRRSIGAILKKEYGLKAIPRSPKRSKQDLYCYKFSNDGEQILTTWMMKNLEIGFHVPTPELFDDGLKELEGKMLIYVKAPLDLDQRTKSFNPLAENLQKLRSICKEEAIKT